MSHHTIELRLTINNTDALRMLVATLRNIVSTTVAAGFLVGDDVPLTVDGQEVADA